MSNLNKIEDNVAMKIQLSINKRHSNNSNMPMYNV